MQKVRFRRTSTGVVVSKTPDTADFPTALIGQTPHCGWVMGRFLFVEGTNLRALYKPVSVEGDITTATLRHVQLKTVKPMEGK